MNKQPSNLPLVIGALVATALHAVALPGASYWIARPSGAAPLATLRPRPSRDSTAAPSTPTPESLAQLAQAIPLPRMDANGLPRKNSLADAAKALQKRPPAPRAVSPLPGAGAHPQTPDLRPGMDDSPEPLSVTWLSYNDYQKLMAERGVVDQPALQRDAAQVAGAPLIPDPNSSLLPGHGGTGGTGSLAMLPRPSPAPDRGADPLAHGTGAADVKPAPADVKPMPVVVKPTPVEAKPAPADVKPVPVVVKPTPVEAKPAPADVKPVPAGAKPTPVVAAPIATPVPPGHPGLPGEPGEHHALPEPGPGLELPKPTGDQGENGSGSNSRPPTPTPNDPSPSHPATPAPPVTTPVVPPTVIPPLVIPPLDLHAPPAIAMLDPRPAVDPLLPPVAVPPAIHHPAATQPAGNPGANPGTNPGASPPAAVSSSGRPGPPGLPGQPDARPSGSPRVDSESPPVSREGLPHVVRPGKVIAGEGIVIKTIVPRWTVPMRFVVPNNPIAKLTFNRRGEVVKVEMERSTGSPAWDSPIIESLYQWTASGKKLQQIQDTWEFEVHILLGGLDEE